MRNLALIVWQIFLYIYIITGNNQPKRSWSNSVGSDNSDFLYKYEVLYRNLFIHLPYKINLFTLTDVNATLLHYS